MERLVEKKGKVAETTVILGLLAITLILAGLLNKESHAQKDA